jgi:iron complex outermembrane receptor protein
VTGITGAVDFRFRLEDAGQRTSRVESNASRLVIGATGTLAGWDYDTALSQSTNKATDTDLSGWVSLSKLEAGLKAGSYNPFVKPADRSAGQAFMNSIRLDGAARISKGTSTSIDGKLTRAIGALAGGDVMLALGAEFRKEKTEFRATDVLKSNDVNNDRSSSGEVDDADHSRNVAGVFAEVSAPITRELEAQFALRHDRYNGVYDAATNTTSPDLSTTNPKVGLSWRPSKQLLARASYGTGFRAPTVSEMFLPVRSGITSSFVRDPVSGEVGQLNIDHPTPSLKPEEQAGEPGRGVRAGARPAGQPGLLDDPQVRHHFADR